MPRIIKLMPDYDCQPLWRVEPGVGEIDPASLPLSERTRAALDRWADVYDQTLNRDDPRESGFPDEKSREAFEAEGVRLWHALQRELGGDIRVLYFSQLRGRVLEPEEYARELAERLGPLSPAERVRSLLDSPSVSDRRDGIEIAREKAVEATIPRLLDLLDDDAPYLFRRGERRYLAEVRSDALVALEELYRRGRKPIDFGPVKVRKALLADEAQAAARRALGELESEEREGLLRRVNEFLSGRVKPRREVEEEVRAYRVLQELGRIDYELQKVDPDTYLTPLQAEVYAGQVQTAPPAPYLAISAKDEPEKILGYLFREEPTGPWCYRFAESSEADRAQSFVARVLSVEKSGVPRVLHDASGRPRRNPDGSLMLDGVIPDKTGEPVEYLKSLAAFLERRYAVSVVESKLG